LRFSFCRRESERERERARESESESERESERERERERKRESERKRDGFFFFRGYHCIPEIQATTNARQRKARQRNATQERWRKVQKGGEKGENTRIK
jgi:hypothetical protein